MILTTNCLVCMKTVMDGKNYSSRFTTKKETLKNLQLVKNGNIYRVPTELSENPQVFNKEFAETMEILQTMRSHAYIGGDFNIDLLKVNQKRHYNAFFLRIWWLRVISYVSPSPRG